MCSLNVKRELLKIEWKGKIYKYRGSLQKKGINHMEIKEKLKENTEFTCGENIKKHLTAGNKIKAMHLQSQF